MSSPAEESQAIHIRVVKSDALSYETDVLVLKYAQAGYGVDGKAALRMAIDRDHLPRPGAHSVFPGHPGIGAGAVLFVGTRSLSEFGYLQVRDFGRRALTIAAGEFPRARTIALTLHGAGYGLDEMESFDSELAGILDAISEGGVPPMLEQVSIVEIETGRAERMRLRLESILQNNATVARGATAASAVRESSSERLRSVGYDSASRAHAFVAMPFASSFDDTFHYGISKAVSESGLLCERIDDQEFTGAVLARLKDQIRTAEIVIADLTDANPNVYLEVGFAWGAGVETVLVCRKDSELRFDVEHERCLLYKNIKDLEARLTRTLEVLVTPRAPRVPG